MKTVFQMTQSVRALPFFMLTLFLWPLSMHAATLFLDPPTKDIHTGDTFIVTLRISPDGECINAAEVVVAYDPAIFRAVGFGEGQSLFTLWPVPPQLDLNAGTVSFSGGIPGGYCGRITGDPGLTNVIGKIAFTVRPDLKIDASVPALHTAITLSPDSHVYLNDGLGTKATVKLTGTQVGVMPAGAAPAVNEWIGEIHSDTIAPELFTVDLHRDPKIFDGKYFIVFSTTDKQSGVNHYEVLETDPWKFGFWRDEDKKTYWLKTESPYVLTDQRLLSKIYVKAVDEAGNERIVEFVPDTARLQKARTLPIVLGAVGAAALLVLVVIILKIRSRKKALRDMKDQ